MIKIAKTNAARLLDRLDIKYELIAYRVDEDDLSAGKVAGDLGFDVMRIYKTLVASTDRGDVVIFVIPGGRELNLKAAAALSRSKKISMVPVRELQALTGYIRGGCSPIGMKRNYPTYIDSSCLSLDHIYISAGMKGLQLRIDPNDLVRFTNARVGMLSQ